MSGRAPHPVRVLGRYALYDEIASGGMATVHFGRLIGPVGFSRTVAIKRLHPQYAKDPEFVSMFLDEARLAARIRHPNVVQTLDVVALEGELFLVMEYVQGESLSRLVRAAQRKQELIPPPYATAIAAGILYGLHAAHEARGERREALGIVHRDVSPQNILVCTDGIARLVDFGVAKAAGRMQTTRDGQLKGKIAYMSPEQLGGAEVDRRTDIYALGVVLWEALTGRRLFEGENDGAVYGKVLASNVGAPSTVAPDVPVALDAIVLRALARDPNHRFATAREMARALEAAVPLVASADLGEWVEATAAAKLAARASAVVRIESESSSDGGLEVEPDDEASTIAVATPPVASVGTSPVASAGASLDPPDTVTVQLSSASFDRANVSRSRPRLASALGIVGATVLFGGLLVVRQAISTRGHAAASDAAHETATSVGAGTVAKPPVDELDDGAAAPPAAAPLPAPSPAPPTDAPATATATATATVAAASAVRHVAAPPRSSAHAFDHVLDSRK